MSQLSIDMKKESIQTLKDFINNQEIELNEQLRKNKETQETMQQFMKEQLIILANLREKSSRMEEDNYEKGKELSKINGEIMTIEGEIKQMKGHLEVS